MMTSSKEKPSTTHLLVVPYPAPGHMLPLLNLTHKLAQRGLTITILVSPKNLTLLSPLLSLHPNSNIQPLIIPFPSHPSIPAGVENMQDLPLSYLPHIFDALQLLYDPVLSWFQSHPHPPVTILSDIFQSWWTCRLSHHLGIKRIGFAPTNAKPLCSWWSVGKEKPDEDFPDVPEPYPADISSWGFVVNSFNELEPDALDTLKNKVFKHDRLWAVGPLLEDRKKLTTTTTTKHESIAWLDSCQVDGSVVYVGFGTQITLTCKQMEAVANALETSCVKFVWSVKPPMKGVETGEGQNVIPAGFEERVSESGRGMIIKDWAPQAEILKHRAVGAYLTHCGWNSVLEGMCSGVVLLAWPMQADHFLNAKLMIDELGVGMRVCKGLGTVPDSVELALILAESVNVTRSERVRAMEMRSVALKAIGEGGSSYKAIDNIVDELAKLN